MAANIQLKDFTLKTTPDASDIVYLGNSADSFNEVKSTVGSIIASLGVTPNQVQESAFNFVAATGSDDAFVVNLNPAVSALTDGLIVAMSSGSLQNLTTTPTLTVNSLAPVNIVLADGALAPFDISPTNTYLFIYNFAATTFELINPTISTANTFFTQANSYNAAINTGTANAYAVTLTPAPLTPYGVGFPVYMLVNAGNSNTGTSTLEVNGDGGNPIYLQDGTNLPANYLLQNQLAYFLWSSHLSGWVLINPAVETGGVISVSGTTDRITSTGGATPVIDIASTYAGQSSITTLGTVTTGVWNGTTLAIAKGGTGVTSVTTAPTASAYAGWDANRNLSADNFIPGLNSTVTSGGTLVLTADSAYEQQFTGSTFHVVQMPVASTLSRGFSFKIVNNSSQAVSVQTSSGSSIRSMNANTCLFITCILTSGTTPASWNTQYLAANNVGAYVQIFPSGNQFITAGNLSLGAGGYVSGTTTNPFTVRPGTLTGVGTTYAGVIASSSFNNSGALANAAQLFSIRSRSSDPAVFVPVQTGDILANWQVSADDGTSIVPSGALVWSAAGTIATGAVPSLATFQTANAAGTLTTAWTVDDSQVFALTNALAGASGGTGIANTGLTIDLASGASGYLLTSDSSGNAAWAAPVVDVTETEVQQSAFNYAVASGANDAWVAALTPTVTSMTDGLLVSLFIGASQNDTTTPTLAIDALTPVPITLPGGLALNPLDMSPDGTYQFIYNGTLNTFVLLNASLSIANTYRTQVNYNNGAFDGGFTNSYLINLPIIPPGFNSSYSFPVGFSIFFIPATTNTAAPYIQLTINGYGFTIEMPDHTGIPPGAIVADRIAWIAGDGTNRPVLMNSAVIASTNNWVDQTTSSVTMTPNTGYTANAGASLISFTLPATSAVGDTLEINGLGSGLWIVLQGAGQQIVDSPSYTTLGTGGSLSSTGQYDNAVFRCLVADTIWTVTAQNGTGLDYV